MFPLPLMSIIKNFERVVLVHSKLNPLHRIVGVIHVSEDDEDNDSDKNIEHF